MNFSATISNGQGIFMLLPAVAAAALSALGVRLLRPLLQAYALARPNARSSHSTPTPQGGGIAVIGAAVLVLVVTLIIAPVGLIEPFRLAAVFASALGLAVVGVTDDIRPLDAFPRLLLQTIAAFVVIAALPTGLQVFTILPWWLERTLMLVAVLWFVNLVNFMDGIDWMTVAEVVPLTAALALFGLLGALPQDATLVATTLCGATIGFAPFNRPVARLFLGDVGSLPLGLLLGWLLILIAEKHLAAALLLPMYYLADATITLLRRLISGQQIMQAHRGHYYQRALDAGFSVHQIVGRVFLVNVALAGLALLTILKSELSVQILSLVIGGTLVGALLWDFSRTKKTTS